jgi:hypothetical protein
VNDKVKVYKVRPRLAIEVPGAFTIKYFTVVIVAIS